MPVAVHYDTVPRFNRFPGAPIRLRLFLPRCAVGRLEEAHERLTIFRLGSDGRYSDLLRTDGAVSGVRRARAARTATHHRTAIDPPTREQEERTCRCRFRVGGATAYCMVAAGGRGGRDASPDLEGRRRSAVACAASLSDAQKSAPCDEEPLAAAEVKHSAQQIQQPGSAPPKTPPVKDGRKLRQLPVFSAGLGPASPVIRRSLSTGACQHPAIKTRHRPLRRPAPAKPRARPSLVDLHGGHGTTIEW